MSLLILSLFGCDHTGFEFRPAPSDAASVSDLGELTPLRIDEWVDAGRDPFAFPDSIVYSEIGADENPGILTGATAHFRGTGDVVCLVLDPETVFWSRSMASTGAGRYKYDDDYTDDGDLDMDAGLTAFYTGSPGVEMGDFAATYTDDVGVDHEIEFNECVQSGFNGVEDIHAGRAAVERCGIDTEQTEGIEYTIALRTFSLPINDSTLGFAVGVFDATDSTCDAIFSGSSDEECLFANEGSGGELSDRSDVETAFCGGVGELNTYCEEHLNDENAPCKEAAAAYDPGNTEE